MYMGHDQYGNYYILNDHPRKELMEQLGSSHVDKMYIQRGDEIVHVGYVIAGHWVTVFGIEGLTFATVQ